ncbi:MAG: hypothetical protein Q8Q09_26080 [Deltaproteobacteria bacterium]|nr:hypothetical protein [Deltaproteobacteria bacterium]
MRNTTHKNTVLSLAFAASLVTACGSASNNNTTGDGATNGDVRTSGGDASAALDLAGRWRNACTPNGSGGGFSLDFELTASEWRLDYVTYAEPACATRMVTVHIEGPYEIGARSAQVSGASEAVFRFTRKTVTAHNAGAVGFLSGLPMCTGPFEVDVARDISASGCAGLGQRPVAACAQDYDLVSVEGDSLRFGQRPADNDMCTADKRPSALAPVSSQRVR